MKTRLPPPPWSGQTVHRAVRWLALAFVGLAAIGFTGMAIAIVTEGVSGLVENPVLMPMLAVTAYMTLLFLYVGRKGKAPAGWAPW